MGHCVSHAHADAVLRPYAALADDPSAATLTGATGAPATTTPAQSTDPAWHSVVPAVRVVESNMAAAVGFPAAGSGPIVASALSALSVAHFCHTDALHCIFAFLALTDLLPALLSCRLWLAAGCKEPSRGLRVCLNLPVSLASLTASPLRRHVAELSFARLLSLRLDQLESLRALPRLTALHATLDGADLETRLLSVDESRERRALLVRAALPTQLCTLTLDCQGAPLARQALIDALPALAALHSLRLDVGTADLDLCPLVLLPRLGQMHTFDSVSLMQCAAVKRLAALTALQTGHGCWERAVLLELLEPPHSLQRLQEIGLGSELTVDPPLMAALLRLPALIALDPGRVSPDCWAGLGGFGQLRSLTVHWPGEFSAAQLSALGAALRALPLLTGLSVVLPAGIRSAGPPVDLRLPALRGLSLRGLRLLSLEFLRHSPLLTYLGLVECRGVRADDALRCLQSFAPQLLRLELRRSALLGAGQVAQLRPPSTLLPALVRFAYEPPRDGH